jgi:hypothetical protein
MPSNATSARRQLALSLCGGSLLKHSFAAVISFVIKWASVSKLQNKLPLKHSARTASRVANTSKALIESLQNQESTAELQKLRNLI